MPQTLSVLCVHGIGHGEAAPDLAQSWTDAIKNSLQRWDPQLAVSCDFLKYDDLFDHAPLNPLTYAGAMASLLASGIAHSVGDLFARRRGLFDLPDKIRWTAGMVAQWATEDKLRQQTRDAVLAKLRSRNYDLICAHSLGSLICYDIFSRNPEAIKNKCFLSFGSQIGNPFVRDALAGRIEPLPEARMWYHLYNPDDHVFTAEIRLATGNFAQIGTEFDIENDPLNHDAIHYLSHPNAVASAWRDISGAPLPRAMVNGLAAFRSLNVKPRRRALLIGINDYPDPANHLEGCVNDVFLMSSVLQECGFAPEDIRVVLDERATAAGIRDRLHWLLDDVRAGDQRMLFYSGHGAQIPAYGDRDEVDRVDECLVPCDFDWSAERAITDNFFFELYSQLPYDSRFVAVFDCCHSGGMTREGGRRVRGVTPPDDIRHRALRWNGELQMWEERTAGMASHTAAYDRNFAGYVGASGIKQRLGRAARLRRLPRKQYDQTRKALNHKGPYLPIIMEACQEDELASEYRHGVTSYGAYTYCLAQTLRQRRQQGKNPSFEELTELVGERLNKLKYDQAPALVGPQQIITQPVPWSRQEKTAGKRKR